MEPLGEAYIRDQAGDKIFARGEDYWKRGAILSIEKRGQSLRGKVEGSDFEPYRVVVRWQSDGEVEAICTCPYASEWGEWCKHIVALLLEYDNEVVPEQPPLAELLGALSKQELVELLVAASERKPEFYEAVIAVLNGEEPEEEELDY